MIRPALISVVVPVAREPQALAAAYGAYREALAREARRVEFIYILDGPQPAALEQLRRLRRDGEPIEILAFAQPFGEAATLTVGFRQAQGEIILTLPPDLEIEPAELPLLLGALTEADMAIGRRAVATSQRLPAPKFERFVNLLFGTDLHDIRSPVRAMKAEVAKELTLYGNQFRFLPLLAQAEGFIVKELGLRARSREPSRAALVQGFSLTLDALAVFFLLRFLRKPFRFFGGFGFAVLLLGVVFTGWLVFARLVLGVPLVDRPSLVLSTLLIVLGIQIISVGLIGEIVTFAYARDIKDYRVDRIVEPELAASPTPADA